MLQWPNKTQNKDKPLNLVILDRDGVINYDSPDYIKSPEEWRPIEGSLSAIADLTTNGFTVAIVTNQSAVNRHLIDDKMLLSIHENMLTLITKQGGKIDQIAYCPHRPNENCLCRKPATGMFEQLTTYYQQDLAGVPYIGDSLKDLDVADAFKLQPILVLTGNGHQTLNKIKQQQRFVPVFRNLKVAVNAIINKNLKASLHD